MKRSSVGTNLLLEQESGISKLFDLLVFRRECTLRDLCPCAHSLEVTTKRRLLNGVPLRHAFQVLITHPCKFFTVFHQLDMLTFECFILYLKRFVIFLELSIVRTKPSKVLISSFRPVQLG